ncbi:hypothetical protein, conserved [Trypanosoma brucei gambiense DAL972]|uniref:Uncharacterized protein n=1 Tax=Trypanosoma brucei gambiense (strain MHOM/CI/86/DAL972) TaxID=679716 RepID=D0AAJ4_TRYB9|nr:hypothetical protein, conserved [Trypanosoma brucei gambiense DAL972]CBH18695.1 hypothetical protein, conserved [Trypanosoma brucei gambiense DAL972]|eukprot:XP_011780959.1 hypothetical protein, conserved [Trypanosoma brucei gambiense DAL972]
MSAAGVYLLLVGPSWRQPFTYFPLFGLVSVFFGARIGRWEEKIDVLYYKVGVRSLGGYTRTYMGQKKGQREIPPSRGEHQLGKVSMLSHFRSYRGREGPSDEAVKVFGGISAVHFIAECFFFFFGGGRHSAIYIYSPVCKYARWGPPASEILGYT